MKTPVCLLVLLLLTYIGQVHTQCYIPTEESQVRRRSYGPIQVATRFDCAKACNCASLNYDYCSSFTPPIPPVNCLAYSFDPVSLQCALLADTREDTCTVPTTIYKLTKVVVDENARFSVDLGYRCPAGFIPYLQIRTDSVLQYFGNIQIFAEEADHWEIRYYINLKNRRTDVEAFPCTEGQEIRCRSIQTPDAKCDFYPVLFKNAFRQGNTFERMDGFKWKWYGAGENGLSTDKPNCTAGKWDALGGGVSLVECEPN